VAQVPRIWGPGRPQRPTVGPRAFPSQYCAGAPSRGFFARWAGGRKSRVAQVPRIWGPGRPQRPTVGPRAFPSQYCAGAPSRGFLLDGRETTKANHRPSGLSISIFLVALFRDGPGTEERISKRKCTVNKIRINRAGSIGYANISCSFSVFCKNVFNSRQPFCSKSSILSNRFTLTGCPQS